MSMKRPGFAFGLLCATLLSSGLIQAAPAGVPADRLLSNDQLVELLDSDGNPALANIRSLFADDERAGLQALAAYHREAFSQRFYFDWKNTERRFDDYQHRFSGKRKGHEQQKNIHLSLYPARARWKLPFDNLKGEPVTAYELRHLARQHKVLDMAFMHLYENRNPEYVDYFTGQMRSLNTAFEAGAYEVDEDGNGVYESFRAGYRVMNWLQVHAFFLGSEAYGWEDQLELIRTLLHTGAMLQERNTRFRYGNHQTRGAVALAMIAILLRDYSGTDAWYANAIDILGQHLDKEVNPDGFQFERSIHYHVGDILNFFRVLQLAQLNGMEVPDSWRAKLKSMFDAAVLLARSDRTLPVLQDDTDAPWSEFNEMADFMLLGAILFDDPVINYFAADSVESAIYWLLREKQIEAIPGLDRNEPTMLSAELPDTGYYVMREGWDDGDYYMVVSAGLSENKPDHQHGDMLGLVARANGQEILPNYQVRYSLPDYEYFKNSFVKNVAIVDSVPHGTGWLSNRGGSGFGKWKKLPQPEVIAWLNRDDWDFFAGTHDGYRDRGVDYYRSVLFLKGLGWVVRDSFSSSSGDHDFQQVWQGHYSDEGGGNHHRSAFADGSGLEILQLGDRALSWSSSTRRGKGNLVYSLTGGQGSYLTLLYPYRSFSSRLPDAYFDGHEVKLNGRTISLREGEGKVVAGYSTDARVVIKDETGAFLFGASRLGRGDQSMSLGARGDFRLSVQDGEVFTITSLWHEVLETDRGSLEPGASLKLAF